jgi:glycosyltransferase involved in cell wall biosynthesis
MGRRSAKSSDARSREGSPLSNQTPIAIGKLSKSRRIPRVSIGLPVYNGERFLRQSIDSILAQTFRDFELVVCDNASTDATGPICEEYATRDPRVRYFRNSRNIGGINNANLTFLRSRGELFRWAAHDDVCGPTLLERCVEVLDDRPRAVGVYPGTINIDEDGNETGTRYGKEGTAPRPHARFRQLSYRHHPCEPIYGVIRSEVLRRTRLQQNYTGSDRALLCELGLHGPFVRIPEPLFYKRYHAGNQYKDWRGRMAWFLPDLQNSGKPTFPNWLQLLDYLETVRRVPLPFVERQLCRLWICRWAVQQSKGLAWDVISAARMLLHSREWRTRMYRDTDRWQ